MRSASGAVARLLPAGIACSLWLGTGSARAQSQSEIDRMWSIAQDDYAAGRYQAAANELAVVLDEDPYDVDAYVRLAQCQARLGEDPDRTDDLYHQNVALLARGLERVPGQPLLEWQLGMTLWGRSDKAPQLLEQALAARPDLYDAAALLGHYYLERHEGAKAAKAFEQYLAARPAALAEQDAGMRLSLGRAWLLAEQPDRAIGVLEALRADQPGVVAVAVELGDAYLAGGDCDKGIPILERIVDHAASHPEIIYDLSACYLRTGRALAALKVARRYVEDESDDPAGHMLLGDIFRRTHDYNSALGEYERAYGLDVGSEEVGLKLAQQYRDAHLPDRAVAVMERLVRARPEDLELKEGLATAYVAVGRVDEAIGLAEQVLGASPNDPAVQALLGEVYYAAGKLDESVDAFQAALKITPGLTRAVSGLRAALAARAQEELRASDPAVKDKAEQDLLLAQSLDVDDEEINRDLAIYYLDRDNAQAAAAILDRVEQKQPDGFYVNYLLYRTALALGKAKAAGPYLERAVVAVGKGKARVRGQPLAIAVNELAALYVQAGQVGPAIQLFEKAVEQAETPELRRLAQRNLAAARETRGLSELAEAEKRDQRARLDPALEDLAGATSDLDALDDTQRQEYRCTLAIADLQAGGEHAAEALTLLHDAGSCPLADPYSKAGLDLFVAVGELEKGDLKDSLNELEDGLRLGEGVLARAAGPAAAVLRPVMAAAAARLGYFEYAVRKDAARGAALTREAARYRDAGQELPALENNLAVLDFAGGQRAAAEKTWAALGGEPAAALLNLGIARDAGGDPKAAYELYERAARAGVPVPPEWTDLKRRIYGGELK